MQLLRSLLPALTWLGVLQVIQECIYGPGASTRLRQQGMEFTVWTFKHASEEHLEPMAAPTLQALLGLLDAGDLLMLPCWLPGISGA